MSGMKLFGSYSGAFGGKKQQTSDPQWESGPDLPEEPEKSKKPKKKRTALDRVLSLMLVLVVLEGLYCTLVFSDIGFIKKYRDIWIQTAMSTMRHQWLATYFLPGCVIEDVMAQQQAAQNAQIGVNSQRPGQSPELNEPEEFNVPITSEEEFYNLFWELDRDSMQQYLDEHPEILANGWENLYINEAGLDDDGTEIETTMGEQVLAIDAKDKLLLVRVTGDGYRGVLAIGKKSEQLAIHPSAYLPSVGQCAGEIAEQYNGVLAMTASGFIDDGGAGNGGTIAGYSMMNGVELGAHMDWSYKRLELHEDNRLYLADTQTAVASDVTDAVEFTPALIVDGVTLVDENHFWNAVNPRACMGQSDKGEFLMLVIEGRRADSLGTGVVECASIFERHNCMQAMNLDGGTSAIMWFDGEYVTHCSNAALPSGRQLPNAFVYARVDE